MRLLLIVLASFGFIHSEEANKPASSNQPTATSSIHFQASQDRNRHTDRQSETHKITQYLYRTSWSRCARLAGKNEVKSCGVPSFMLTMARLMFISAQEKATILSNHWGDFQYMQSSIQK